MLSSKRWIKKPDILASSKQKRLIAGRRANHSSVARPIKDKIQKMVRNLVIVFKVSFLLYFAIKLLVLYYVKSS